MAEPDSDGFIPLRDRHGVVWAAYNPQTQVLRYTRRQPHRSDCPNCEQVADISLAKLAAGEQQVITTFTRSPRSRRLID